MSDTHIPRSLHKLRNELISLLQTTFTEIWEKLYLHLTHWVRSTKIACPAVFVWNIIVMSVLFGGEELDLDSLHLLYSCIDTFIGIDGEESDLDSLYLLYTCIDTFIGIDH